MQNGLAVAGAKRLERPRLRRHQFGGSIGGPLPLLNFGENNDPMFRSGKDKAFFFFDNERRRDRSETPSAVIVPLPTFRAGNVGYINNNAGCTSASRLNTQPSCISYLTPAQLAALDPQHIGVNQALLGLYNSRFPLPNDPTIGDGVNTGGYRFNAPNVRDDKIYSLRLDFLPTDRQSLYISTRVTRRASTNSIQFLPQDPDSVFLNDKSYAIAVGHTWTASPNFTNQAVVGIISRRGCRYGCDG